MDVLEWSLGLGGWISIVAFACIAHTGSLDAVRYVLFIGVPIVAVSVTYAILSIAWQLLLIILWAITLMFRRDILFTVVTIGILAAASATIHNVYSTLMEEDEAQDYLSPLRTLCKIGKLIYERSLPSGYHVLTMFKAFQPYMIPYGFNASAVDAVDNNQIHEAETDIGATTTTTETAVETTAATIAAVVANDSTNTEPPTVDLHED